ncbi:MAG: DUF2971 domain-containing protein [Nitrosomonas sp.]|nr:DUF2971 domain-containing protein [Nitrosomonas sp.]MDP1949910.1 DUF2971 domain-containing protein [Nitrosomonas sp.]
MTALNSLYKYHSLTAYSLASLTNNTIWLAKPSSFNDPFDCAFFIDDRSENMETVNSCQVGTRDVIQNLGICSFSEVPDNILMWSHYANHHKGFCVEYDFSEGTHLRLHARKVSYKDELPILKPSDIKPNMEQDKIYSLWLEKAKCWSYEKEWRVIMGEGNKSCRALSAVISVTFGARMPESDRLMVSQALKHESDIKFMQANLRDDRYEIEISDISF